MLLVGLLMYRIASGTEGIGYSRTPIGFAINRYMLGIDFVLEPIDSPPHSGTSWGSGHGEMQYWSPALRFTISLSETGT